MLEGGTREWVSASGAYYWQLQKCSVQLFTAWAWSDDVIGSANPSVVLHALYMC